MSARGVFHGSGRVSPALKRASIPTISPPCSSRLLKNPTFDVRADREFDYDARNAE